MIVTLCINHAHAQNSGTWNASGSGSTTTWTSTAGGINITASATNYGSGTSYTLNDFQTNDTMGCNNSAYSDTSIVGNPSLSVRHTFPNTAQITFTFSTAVENPVMHFDRLGGGEVNSLTSSSIITILTPGITFTELSGNGTHFETTSTTVGRDAGQTYNSLPSECGPPLDGTAAGSVRLNGVFNTVTFSVSMDAVGSTSTVNDRFEIAFSDVKNLALDFDGVDDYINTPAFLGGLQEVTMMTWIKLDSNFNGGDIMGQHNFNIYLEANKQLKTFIKTDSGINSTVRTPILQAPTLTTNMWYHVAAIYNNANGTLQLFLNGNSVWEYSLLNGSKIIDTAAWNSNHDFEIGRNSKNDNNYFEGSIYETRIYKKALTEKQLHQQINQEIENNNGNVRGKIIPKDIDNLSWNDLILYYNMEVLNTGKTPDISSSNIDGNLHNMRTYQEQTAPLPYITKSGGSGNWCDSNNWLHGDIWDITGSHPDCAIVVINDDLITNTSHSTTGLIIQNGNKLTVNDDSGIENKWYLKLDGKIDLNSESQLIQTMNSELDITSAGTIEKEQQGTQDVFTYNYWSSPVGNSNTTSNNNSYSLSDNIFKDGSNPLAPSNINFVSGYNGSNGTPISIANYWIWKFNNHATNDYASWQHIRHTGTILAGEGFTMKGVNDTNNNVSLTQNYVIEGKPNNGDISLPINANNDYLVGNPYPSALDAEQFILDNGPTIDGATPLITGTIYYWEHWGGGSHNLADYQGGYATYNLSGGIPSASKGTNDPNVATGGTAAKVPGRYIPVAQGFFVTGEANGTIDFNNGQRVFQKEGDGSVFVRTTANANNDDGRIKLRLGFNSVNEMYRQLLVTVDERATLEYDWGFDGKNLDDQMDDMSWIIEDENYLIQGINEINESTVLPIGIKTRNDGNNTITIDDLVNFPEDIQVYLRDKELDTYHNLRTSAFQINLPAGEYLNRFEIAFTNQSLSVEDFETNNLDVFFANTTESIVINNPKNIQIDAVKIINMLGQTAYRFNKMETKSYLELKTKNLSSGTYIIKLKTEIGEISKKVLVN